MAHCPQHGKTCCTYGLLIFCLPRKAFPWFLVWVETGKCGSLTMGGEMKSGSRERTVAITNLSFKLGVVIGSARDIIDCPPHSGPV